MAEYLGLWGWANKAPTLLSAPLRLIQHERCHLSTIVGRIIFHLTCSSVFLCLDWQTFTMIRHKMLFSISSSTPGVNWIIQIFQTFLSVFRLFRLAKSRWKIELPAISGNWLRNQFLFLQDSIFGTRNWGCISNQKFIDFLRVSAYSHL